MSSRLTASLAPRRTAHRPDGGYSLTELLFVVLVGSTLMAMTGVSVGNAINYAKANSAMQVLRSILVEGHDAALSSRRNVEVRFVGTNVVELHRVNPDGTEVVFSSTRLEGGNTFQVFAGIPDTPDAFGHGTAISFQNAAAPYYFTSEGAFVDALGAPLSGTVSIGVTNHPESQRAVTVFGGTGRVNSYAWNGTQWEH
ncbi:MAG: hypothetical protein U0Q12_24220 [Vicinamibacterales bacterium]